MFEILVVEDDFNTRKLLETILTQHGYNPVPAPDGIEALQFPAGVPAVFFSSRPMNSWISSSSSSSSSFKCAAMSDFMMLESSY